MKPVWTKSSNRLALESLAALKTIILHFHDLRAEFGSRAIESAGSTTDVRDLLGHTTTKQTDTYLRSRLKGLHRAIERKELHEAQLAADRARQAEALKHSHTAGEDVAAGDHRRIEFAQRGKALRERLSIY